MSALSVEPSSDTTSATIFVVDPDILVRMVIADYLRECGYKVVEGVNADDVLVARVIQNEGKAASVLCGRRR